MTKENHFKSIAYAYEALLRVKERLSK